MEPRCTLCAEPAVLHQAYSGNSLCREHFLLSFTKRAKLEVALQGRLPAGRLAVALSGGKDSVALLHFLHGMLQERGSPHPGQPATELLAITVDEGIAGYRDSALAICRDVTTRLGVPWHVVRTQDLAGYDIDAYAAGNAGPASEPPGERGRARAACGPCGVYRRAGMNRLARELGCAAIATGHNLDDQAQTVLMNHLKGDIERLARLAPHLGSGSGPVPAGLVPRLMPLRTIPEKEVLLYALLTGLPLHDEAECPYAARSDRFAVRDVLVQLEEKTPGTRHALVKGHERLKPLLAAGLPPMPVGHCLACGDVTSGAADCMACRLRA